MGTARIDLEEVEPFQGLEKTIHLSHDKHGDKGWIRVHLNFQPEIIVKSRAKTSTLSSAGRAMTRVGALPLQAGRGVLHGITRVFGRGGQYSDSPEDKSITDVAEMGTGQASQPIGANGEPGIVRVTVIEAKDYNPGGDGLKPYVILKSGDKEHKTSHRPKSTGSECSW